MPPSTGVTKLGRPYILPLLLLPLLLLHSVPHNHVTAATLRAVEDTTTTATTPPPPPDEAVASPADTAGNMTSESDLITSLPGLKELPPFKMYSGYLNVNSTGTQARIFYWYVEAQTNPEMAPIMWWSNGGPGCSGMLGFGTEHGPFHFGPNQSVTLNPYSWNTYANMLYVEQPVGVGFSYSAKDEPVGTITDEMAANDNYEAIKSFFVKFPELKSNSFYISSESYGGHYIPQLTKTILLKDTNKEINFKGFAVGNPFVDSFSNNVAMYEAWYFHGLVNKPLYDQWRDKCNTPEKFNRNPFMCQVRQAEMSQGMGDINNYAMDYPVCVEDSDVTLPEFIHQRMQLAHHMRPQSTGAGAMGGGPVIPPYEPCAENYFTSFLNNPKVQQALHVENAPVTWTLCASFFSGFIYDYDDVGTSQIPLYKELVTDLGRAAGLNMLVFSGDDDSVCALSGTQDWIYNLGVKVSKSKFWQPWTDVQNQTAGYVTKFDLGCEAAENESECDDDEEEKTGASFTLVTVRGAGHEVPAYKPMRALHVIKTFLDGEW